MDFPVSLHAHGVLYDKMNEGRYVSLAAAVPGTTATAGPQSCLCHAHTRGGLRRRLNGGRRHSTTRALHLRVDGGSACACACARVPLTGTPCACTTAPSCRACFSVPVLAQVPKSAGPGPTDGSSVAWPYHSHVNEPRDTNTGLLGMIIVTAKGKARVRLTRPTSGGQQAAAPSHGSHALAAFSFPPPSPAFASRRMGRQRTLTASLLWATTTPTRACRGCTSATSRWGRGAGARRRPFLPPYAHSARYAILARLF